MSRFWHNIPGNGLGSTGQREMAHGLGPDYVLTPVVPPVVPPGPGPPAITGPQQGDVKLFQTTDDGEITVESGIVEMSGGLETSAYLSMFGGDEDLKEWWGNFMETEPARKYRSETQQVLDTVPATSGGLRALEDAARRDLEWFITESVASTVDITASIPAQGRVRIAVSIEAQGVQSDFSFVENWEAAQISPAQESTPAGFVPAGGAELATTGLPAPHIVTGGAPAQQGDVRLFQTTDDGEIKVEGGIVEMSGGLETAAYLSMFGGDEDLQQWWGNISETDPARQYRSETQQVLDTIPAIPANLRRLEDSARRDLAWFISESVASTVDVNASIESLNRVSIAVIIEANGVRNAFNFVENWEAAP